LFNSQLNYFIMKKVRVLFLFIALVTICLKAYSFNFIVAQDGSGDYKTIQAAIDAVTSNNQNRTTIFIKNGYYFEKCKVTNKINLSLIGQNVDSVIIAWNDYSGKVSGMSGATAMTFLADATGLYMENITIKNTAGKAGQAPAIKTTGDKMIFNNCRFYGYQDTYYANKNRQYNYNCYIEGAVDFIYGDAQAVFENCTLNCVVGGGYITAPSDPKAFRTIEGVEYSLGLLFDNCTITASAGVQNGKYYLGRPWGIPKATSVYVNCTLGPHIARSGWTLMTTDAEKTAFFAEYKSKNGDGTNADISGRISWSKQLTENQYMKCYNADSFLYKNGILWEPRISDFSVNIKNPKEDESNEKLYSEIEIYTANGLLINTLRDCLYPKLDGYKNGLYLLRMKQTNGIFETRKLLVNN